MLKTPCNIITGFLGSGKTTLLSHLIKRGLRGQRIAIVMNEIGDIGIDGTVITGLAGVEKMVELNSGCVCCTIDPFAFQVAFEEIQEQVQPDLIVIETTGLADPFFILNRLDAVNVICDAIIALVDAPNFLDLVTKEAVLAQQVKAADFLVLNKTDLVTSDKIRRVKEHLEHLNPRALLLEATYSQVEVDLLFSTGISRYREQEITSSPLATSTPSHHHHQHGADEIQPFSYKTDHPVELASFEQLLSDLPSSIYRAKGFLNLAGEATLCLFNFTCGRFDFQKISPAMSQKISTQAVFIGRDTHKYKTAIISQFQACERPGGKEI